MNYCYLCEKEILVNQLPFNDGIRHFHYWCYSNMWANKLAANNIKPTVTIVEFKFNENQLDRLIAAFTR